MTNKKIICIGPLAEQVVAEFEPEFETIAVSDSSRQEVLDSVDPSVAVIIARGSVVVDAEIMDRAPNLQLVARSGVGYDTVNISDATARGLPVVYTPGAMSRAVAELQAILGNQNVASSPQDVEVISRTNVPNREIPDVVVYPTCADEVQQVMLLANRYRLPV